jgi:hypothetical protein
MPRITKQPQREYTDAELDTIEVTPDDQADADRFMVLSQGATGAVAVLFQSTPDAFCVVERYTGPQAMQPANDHRDAMARVLAEVFAMRRVGL